MAFIRGTLAVVVGYLILALTSMGVVGRLFAEGQPAPENRAVIFSFLALGLGAAVGGFVCTLIVGKANSPAIYITIGVMFVMAGVAYSQGTGVEPDWYRLLSSIALAIGFLVGASGAAYKMDRR